MPTKPWKAILVAVRDPGARKQIAIRKAARIAASSGARITLFHAFSVPFPLPNPTLSDPKAILRAVAKQRREQLQKLARPLRAEGLAVECEAVWDFPPAHAIVRRVLAEKPDLVVAESHRHSRVARWFLANSDWELIRECPCPVWFVKQERLAKNALVLTAIDPTHARAKPAALDDRLLQTSAAVTRGLGGKVVLHTRRGYGPSTADAADRATRARDRRNRCGYAGKHGASRETQSCCSGDAPSEDGNA